MKEVWKDVFYLVLAGLFLLGLYLLGAGKLELNLIAIGLGLIIALRPIPINRDGGE